MLFSFIVDDGISGEVSREQSREQVEAWLGRNNLEDAGFSPPGLPAGNSETWGMLPDHQAGMERAMQMAQGVQES